MGDEEKSQAMASLSANSILASIATPTQTTVLRPLPESFPLPSDIKFSRRSGAGEKAVPEVVISPVFKMVFITVSVLTLLSLAVSIVMSFQDPISKAQEGVLETCSTTWKMGFGAILGLIGGKRV